MMPELYSPDAWKECIRRYNLSRKRDTSEALRERLNEHLQCGDSRAALVLDPAQGIIAAYTDELDCVVLLKFEAELIAPYNWRSGARLLTVNTYTEIGFGIAPDVTPGPNHYARYGNFFPLIADLLTEDYRRLAHRKAQIPESEWIRAWQMGQRAYQSKRLVPRDGRAVFSRFPTQPLPPPNFSAKLRQLVSSFTG
jgi:hypothetical protein